MEKEGEPDRSIVFHSENDFGRMLHEKGMAERIFVSEDIVTAFLISSEHFNEIEDDTCLLGPCRAYGE